MEPVEEQSPAVLSAVQYFEGPIPPPQVLKGYEEALPGLADRIVTMAEEEARHRRAIEFKRETREGKLETRGQMFGFAVAIFSFSVAGILIAFERPLAGMSTVIAAVGGLSGLFIWSRSRSRTKPPEPPERSRGRRWLSGRGD